MNLKVYVVNAFADQLFSGNPAAVVPLRQWLMDGLMQQIAGQHNLAETAFIVNEPEGYRIRWFTPEAEVDLCGHATLASAHIFFNHLGHKDQKITFNSRSGPLHVYNGGAGKSTLDFPLNKPKPTAPLDIIEKGLGIKPTETFTSTFDYMVLVDDQETVQKLRPDFAILSTLKARGIIVTAPGNDVDFVSRCFFPQTGVNEDPVTGSAHTVMVPFWAEKLGKNKLEARQLSARGGSLHCELTGDRVLISGKAITYLEGEIFI